MWIYGREACFGRLYIEEDLLRWLIGENSLFPAHYKEGKNIYLEIIVKEKMVILSFYFHSSGCHCQSTDGNGIQMLVFPFFLVRGQFDPLVRNLVTSRYSFPPLKWQRKSEANAAFIVRSTGLNSNWKIFLEFAQL